MTGAMSQPLVDVLLVALLAALAACAELVPRYRDAPFRAIFSPPGLLYLFINMLVGIAALAVIRVFDWNFGIAAGEYPERVRLIQILAAGLGSAVLFRTSLNFTMRQGNREWSLGPDAVRSVLLRSVDSAIDRRRARVRLGSNRPRVDDMNDLSFRDDLFALTELCTYALQSLDRAEAQRLGGLLRQLSARDELPERVRVEMFCLELRNWVGERALEAAVDRLRHIRHSGAALAQQ